MPRLLQCCNVGRIVGGTAACAWTVTRALSGFEHHVRFFSRPDRETVEIFAPATVSSGTILASEVIAELRPDVVLLHNTPAARIRGRLAAPTVQYLHSHLIDPAAADVTVCCSQWLAERAGMSSRRVLWQAVGKIASLPERRGAANRRNREIVVGRICTPVARKWPRTIVPFYADLTARCPFIRWEFVGCPVGLQSDLRTACGERCGFHPAGWRQRMLFSTWDALLYSHPSLPESFGRTVAEAMRAGCVPVVDRTGGFIEQIPEDGGYLCTSRDEFAAALHRLSDPDVLQAISRCAMRHADKWFSLRGFARNLLTWFNRAATMRAPVARTLRVRA